MSRASLPWIAAACFSLLACGGGTPRAESPESAENPDEMSEGQESAEGPSPAEEGSNESEPSEAEPKSEEAPSAAEPQFTDNMSVAEAEKAVPAGGERRNIDQETLGKPLQNLELYEPCKPGTTKVKFRVAVWDGKAVGIDMTTTPKNDRVAECIKGKIREITWDKKVKSLNTIEYQF